MDMTHLTSKYSDIDISFTPHPGQVAATGKGDFVTKTDVAAIKTSVRNLIQFNTGDKPFHPEIAANIRRLLFENVDILTGAIIKRTIGDLLARYEPRIWVEEINVDLENDLNGAVFTITFTALNQAAPIKMEIRLERVR